MSRMIAWTSRTPTTLTEVVGPERARQFADLSRLHADGWGLTRWTDAGMEHEGGGEPFPADRALDLLRARPARAGVLYLRFASAGSPVIPENAQPFVHDRLAFAHNGAFDRTAALGLLGPAWADSLRGGADSEVYFALVRERLHGGDAPSRALASAAAALRTLAPDASLNAFLQVGGDVYAIRDSAGRPAPLAAFAARGVAADQLPPGHDETYNRLWAHRAEDAAAVATTGIDLTGWTELPEGSVTLLRP